MSNWMKYTFVCDPNECDALLEFTARDGFDFPNGVVQITCPCGRQMQYISANIVEQERKETTPMETMETPVQEAPLHYNPNQLVTYKVIDGNNVSYPTDKVVDIEWTLEQSRRTKDAKNDLQSKINRITDNMTEDYWYNPNTDISTVLEDLCEILEYNPVKTVDFTATVKINGAIEIPMSDAVDFDLETYVFDALSIDTNTGTVDVHDWDIWSVDEC